MKSILKVFSKLFSRSSSQNIIPANPLKVFRGKIDVTRYIEMGNNTVHDSQDLFQTPPEVLKILNGNTVLWVDEINNLLGFSTHKRTLIMSLSDMKGLEIQNILAGKGPGEAYLLALLPHSKFLMFSRSPIVYEFDKYADILSKTLGVTVTFAPEFYNC